MGPETAESAARGGAPPWTDPATHTSGFVRANGVRLHYLSWGSADPTLILIHGANANPHYFDDLAPAFTDRFRVIAYARRGHGESEACGPYDTATLSADLVGFMDALGIAKAHLTGWSMGGNEVTALAGEHPERVDRIVYLEGGYDWADPRSRAMLLAMPVWPDCPLTSMAAHLECQKALMFPGVTEAGRVESFLRHLVVVQPDGTVRSAMGDGVQEAVFEAYTTNPRDYTKVSAPALAIYAQSFWDVQHGDPSLVAEHLAWERAHVTPFRVASIERVRRELPDPQILSVPGTHPDLVFTCRESIVAAMRAFLLGG